MQCSQMVEPLSMVPLIRAKCRQAAWPSPISTVLATRHQLPWASLGRASPAHYLG